MVGQQEPVVTGDAVVLDVQIAQLPVRALSAMIDVTVVFIGYIIGVVLWATTLTAIRSRAVGRDADHLHRADDRWAIRSRSRPRPAAGRWARWRWGCGWCPTTAARNASARRCFVRWPGVIEIWTLTGGPAVICSLLSPKGKRIGDVFAGTVVISERAPRLHAATADAAAAGVVGVVAAAVRARPEQAELARQFLSRASQLDPAMRDQMAYRITGDVVAQISPPPPPGTPPQLVLAAVLAERHRRELARLQAAADGTGRTTTAATAAGSESARSPGTAATAAGYRGIHAADPQR